MLASTPSRTRLLEAVRGLRPLIAAAALSLAGSVGAVAADVITIPGDATYPESITGTSDGTLFIGSLGEGSVFRVPPGGSTAEPFIAKGASDLLSVIGILADEKS